MIHAWQALYKWATETTVDDYTVSSSKVYLISHFSRRLQKYGLSDDILARQFLFWAANTKI